LRTLTLGVLIVSGGTLAALPFRKYQAIPDASSAPAQVTGPTQSALDSADSSQLVTNPWPADQPSSDASLEAINAGALASNLPPWHPLATSQAPRSVDIPLTYDDLAMPIDPPPPIAQRFNATVPIRQQQLEQQRVSALVMPAMQQLAATQQLEPQRVSALVMPAMQQLAATQQLELQRVAESVRTLSDQQNDSKAAGSLASSRDRSLERLPKVAPVKRDRHWIRQPE
jgi:hypothetical protein